MTIKQAQKLVDQWINNYGVRYFNELTNMALLTEEVGEVARIISRKYGDQSFKKSEAARRNTKTQQRNFMKRKKKMLIKK